MSKECLFVAVSNQKGGVGKSALTVVLASYLHYEKDLNVAIIDCDSPQHSLVRMRERDKKAISASPYYQHLVEKQRDRIQKKAYPIIGSTAEKAREAADKLAEEHVLDIVFVDLPGTVESTGVFRTIVNMDYVLTPSIPDLIVMQSTLSFATTVLDYARSRKEVPLKDIIFFWNRLKKRSNTEVLETYSEIMKELNLTVLDSVLPDLCRFEKEITHAKRSFFRCTMLPPPAKLLAGSGIAEMAEELIVKLNLK